MKFRVTPRLVGNVLILDLSGALKIGDGSAERLDCRGKNSGTGRGIARLMAGRVNHRLRLLEPSERAVRGRRRRARLHRLLRLIYRGADGLFRTRHREKTVRVENTPGG